MPFIICCLTGYRLTFPTKRGLGNMNKAFAHLEFFAADECSEAFQIIATFCTNLIAGFPNIFEQIIFHTGISYHQFQWSADDGWSVTSVSTYRTNFVHDGGVCDMTAIPRQQKIHFMHRCHGNVCCIHRRFGG